jgi:hypothetical protein
VQKSAQRQFWTRIATPDPRHDLGAVSERLRVISATTTYHTALSGMLTIVGAVPTRGRRSCVPRSHTG